VESVPSCVGSEEQDTSTEQTVSLISSLIILVSVEEVSGLTT
jgi:hypothetical protein